MTKISNWLFTILCYLPYLYLTIYYSYILRAIIKIGRIPTYNNPDPKELGFNVHRNIVYKSFDIIVYTFGVFLLLLLAAYFLKKLRVKKIHFRLMCIGIVLFILDLLLNPFNEWFLD